MATDNRSLEAVPPRTAPAPDVPPMQVDFAHVVGNLFLAYGWVVGLAEGLQGATLGAGEAFVDVMNDAVKVTRPDVSEHFQTPPDVSHDHGFFVLLDMAGIPPSQRAVRLTVTSKAGVTGHSDWPILHGEDLAAATLRAHERAMRLLIPKLPSRVSRLLTGMFKPPLSLRAGDLDGSVVGTVSGLQIQLQVCCLLGGSILLVGGVLPRPVKEFSALVLAWGQHQFDLLDGLIPVGEPGALSLVHGDATSLAYLPHGFCFAIALPDRAAPTEREIRVLFSGGNASGSVRHTVRTTPQDAQARFVAHLASIDVNARIDVCEKVWALLKTVRRDAALADLVALQWDQAVKSLPKILDVVEGGMPLHMHLDGIVEIPRKGLFLMGWCSLDPSQPFSVICQTRSAAFDVGRHWLRRPRPDVRQHLTDLGLPPLEEPGLCCFVPLPPGDEPCYLAVRVGAGRVWRLRIPLGEPQRPVRETVRSLLALVDPGHRDLMRILSDHVGPAVGSLWPTRPMARERGFVSHYGPPVADPQVSLVVPLYGRYDFADFQLALFADDPDFQLAELIYVVDDPAIVDEFRRLCPDLYGTYRIPFTLAYPGANLGFAGATNFGAQTARAAHLLLLNSDVLPREPGWLSALLQTYSFYPDNGVLGVKLLYEDGTVQHAGMTSRRHAPWGDLWINVHPHKGLSPEGLTGIQEVAGVTAACALIETDLYRSLGGLSEDYIIGDFEDSDLCFRVQAAGRRNRVALDIVLYHLERQSQVLSGDHGWRQGLTVYNCWLHNQRWAQVMAGSASGRASGPAGPVTAVVQGTWA